MQRIDENTYIDDTLVTCAEYQLFIDEMREHGMHYQPDHWTSYQFPAGYARESILGIRHSDAIAFCEWLTQSNNAKWKFRLPTQEEAAHYLIEPSTPITIAYWLHEEFQFVWIGPNPHHAREIEVERACSSVLDRYYSRSMIFDFALTSDLERARTFDQELAFDIDLNLNRTRALDLDRIRDLDQTLVRILDLAFARTHARDPYLNYERTVARVAGWSIASALDLDRPLCHVRGRIGGQRALAQTTVSDLNLYFDIYTLRKRLAGQSPAFEGIRLVKERK